MKSTPGPDELTVGQLAERFGLGTHVLRHWESVGLLAPARDRAGRRRYRPTDLYRVAAILYAKEAGFGLGDIRAMMTTADPASRTGILRRQRTQLVSRIADAQASLELIDHALACEHDDITTCPNFQAAVAARIRRPGTNVSDAMITATG